MNRSPIVVSDGEFKTGSVTDRHARSHPFVLDELLHHESREILAVHVLLESEGFRRFREAGANWRTGRECRARARCGPIFVVTQPRGAPRKLCDDCGGRPRQRLDERFLLIERFGAGANTLAVVDTTTRSQRELLAGADRSVSNPRVSPDSQWVAFDAARPGGAIVHPFSMEIYYIIEGRASLVTGGALDPAPPAPADPDIVRSRTIQNGLTRTVAKGDVIVVPPGTPHWFKAIDGTITYLESRVRVE